MEGGEIYRERFPDLFVDRARPRDLARATGETGADSGKANLILVLPDQLRGCFFWIPEIERGAHRFHQNPALRVPEIDWFPDPRPPLFVIEIAGICRRLAIQEKISRGDEKGVVIGRGGEQI